jgi:hypothetical protein
MLLTEPRPLHRAGLAERNGAPDQHGAEPGEGATWIVVGGLERALLQAGIIGRLLEAQPQPVSVIASGFALANAVLVAGAHRETFERRWEQLRASRFLVSAALGSVRLLGALNGMFDDLVTLIAEIAQAKRARDDAGPEILAATEDGFAKLPHDSTTAAWRAAVKRSLRYTSESAPLIAGAIREAATRGGPIWVLGLERTMQSHPDVDAACRAAAADGARVTFVTATAPRKAGLLDYLLPGSGAPERLMNEGRSAADRCMEGVGQNGSSRPGHAPLAGLGATGGLWTRDASDSSNWLK